MSAFLMYDPRPVYLTLTGEVAAGGTLKFFMAGTTTPQAVYGDSGLTVSNGSTLTLGSDGRTSVEVWGDASKSYRVQLYDANAALVFDQDNVSGAGGSGGSGSIPTLATGKFLTNDGSQLLWAPIRQLPDPTGQANKVLSTDGTNYTWISKPADGEPGSDGTSAAISATDAKTTIGDGTTGHDLLMIQRGSGTAPATGQHNTSASITFPTAFKSAPYVQAVGRALVSGTIGVFATPTVISETGATFTFSTNDDNDAAAIVSAMPFDWMATGVLAG